MPRHTPRPPITPPKREDEDNTETEASENKPISEKLRGTKNHDDENTV
jgi:hypothetical protein